MAIVQRNPDGSEIVTRTNARDPLFDRSSLGYAAIGVLFALRGVSGGSTAAIGVAFEVLRGPLQSLVPGLFPPVERETVAAKAADVASLMAGWALIRALPRHPDVLEAPATPQR